MKISDRYLAPLICQDLQEKMVFVGGPRQVGKTTLSTELIAKNFHKASYFNWDYRQDRRSILDGIWPGDSDLIILDEVHKYKKWKSLIKGQYDKLKSRYHFLVTGSARLDTYRKGGDSLQGRYHYYRLHPFSVSELRSRQPEISIHKPLVFSDSAFRHEFEILYEFGGFPEPVSKQDSRHLRRWHNEKTERLFREDIQDMSLIRDMGSMKLLGDMLPGKVGSQLSINAIREDLEVSHRAASNWLDILESFYYQFRLYPYQKRTIRALKKEPKLYLWDWSEISDKGARFENMIACHLLKLVHFLVDHEGYKADLHYVRDTGKRELDFLVTIDQKPWFGVEVKTNNTDIPKSISYFMKKLEIPFVYQVVQKENIDLIKNEIRIISASKFLTCCP